jgi:hypothetical protein
LIDSSKGGDMHYILAWGFVDANGNCVKSGFVDIYADDDQTAETYMQAKLKKIRRKYKTKYPHPPFHLAAALHKEINHGAGANFGEIDDE